MMKMVKEAKASELVFPYPFLPGRGSAGSAILRRSMVDGAEDDQCPKPISAFTAQFSNPDNGDPFLFLPAAANRMV